MQTFIFFEPSRGGADAIARQIASHLRKIPQSLRGAIRGITTSTLLGGQAAELGGLLDELVVVEVPPEYQNNMEVTENVLADFISPHKPALLLMGMTHGGMELGPSMACRMDVPVVTGCLELAWTAEHVIATRPINGGRMVASFEINPGAGAVICVQKGALTEEEPELATTAVTSLPWQESWAPKKSEVIAILDEELEGEEDITKANILVSVGRGLGDAEGLPQVQKLAEKLGGMVSCSRPVVDLRWLPVFRQVGISGRTVTPAVYLALGISGQNNHLAGMDASRIIIAVNTDPEAPIFRVAHYGVVDDLTELVPELLEQLQKTPFPNQ